jgi:serine-type D-Ala-D-Ala carboxypeptidase (penicillin-binding protein 5/6)
MTAADYFQALPSLPSLPVRILAGGPEIKARSALLIDYDSGEVLYQKNIDQALPPASLTKIMTALIVLEEFPQDQILTVENTQSLGQTIGLVAGEQFRIGDLLYALLVMSGNDIAYVLADAYPGGEATFVARMNQRAEELGMEKTNFVNPHGLDDLNHYLTARDLSRLTGYALKNPVFTEIIKRGNGQICDLTGESCYLIEPTNELLSFPGILGVKTGWTDQAGGCFIGFWEQDSRNFLSVILGSDDRFRETQELLGWGLVSYSSQSFDWLKLLGYSR